MARHAIDARDGPVCAFLGPQLHLATEHCGQLDPTDLDEYLRHDGFVALRRCLEHAAARATDRDDPAKRAARPGRGRFSHRAQVGQGPRRRGRRTSTSSATATRAIPALSWTACCWSRSPIALSKGCASPPARSAPMRASSTSAPSIRWPSCGSTRRWSVAGSAGCWATHVMGSDFALELSVKEGAGAFVCGEETALLASIEGRRGMPRLRPPYPAEAGLWGKPTSVNNVETYALVALDFSPRGRGLCSARHAEESRHESLRPGRQDPPRRADRGADGRDHAADRRGDRRRRGRAVVSRRRVVRSVSR